MLWFASVELLCVSNEQAQALFGILIFFGKSSVTGTAGIVGQLKCSGLLVLD